MVEAEARRRGLRLLDAVERKDLGEVQSLFRNMDPRYESIDVRKHSFFCFATRARLISCEVVLYAQHEVMSSIYHPSGKRHRPEWLHRVLTCS